MPYMHIEVVKQARTSKEIRKLSRILSNFAIMIHVGKICVKVRASGPYVTIYMVVKACQVSKHDHKFSVAGNIVP
jgi:hypothetical protein